MECIAVSQAPMTAPLACALLRQETIVRAQIPVIVARSRVLCSKLLFELVRIAFFRKIAMSRAHSVRLRIKRIAQKLRRIVLLYFGLVAFRFHFGRTRNPLIFIVFGPIGRDQVSQSQYFLSRHQDTPNTTRKRPEPIQTHHFSKYRNFENRQF